jgi:hypothetical protein
MTPRRLIARMIQIRPGKDSLESMLPGSWCYSGPVDWESQENPLLTVMQRQLVLDPVDARPPVQALSGRWYDAQDRLGAVVRDMPRKNHPWSDLGTRSVISLRCHA